MSSKMMNEKILVTTERMLCDILICEGISEKNARALALRICGVLPDLPSLMETVEARVVEQLLSEIERDVLGKVTEQVEERLEYQADATLGNIDSSLVGRLDGQARELIEEQDEEKRKYGGYFAPP